MSEQYIDTAVLSQIRENLWRIAMEKRITLEDIQDRTEFSYSQVYRIVRGKNNISVSGLVAVCKALEVHPVEVFRVNVTTPNYPPLRRDRKKK